MFKYYEMTLLELKSALKRRNAKTSGRKKELIERLESYDRNSNFGQPDVNLPEFYMSLPAINQYRDINSEQKIPPICLKNINLYLSTYDKKLEDNAINLYKEKYLCYLRLCSEESYDYIKSACRAEMKKAVSYQVDLSISRSGFIHEAQCECAAGMGPSAHCKHVCAVLYACCEFYNKGTVLLEQTCTQKLQTFHHTKRYTGSPLKVGDLDMPGADELSLLDFDPRPDEYRNSASYNSYFRNVCLNFKGISAVPIFQLFTPANGYAVAHDHDYLQETPETIFLRHMCISTITDKQRVDVEFRTRGQASNEFWYEERGKRLQSSNFGRVCKATERTDFRKLSSSLITQKSVTSAAILHGRKYEQVAIQRYKEDFDCSVDDCGIFVSKSMPFLGSSPDGIVNESVLCEVKCPFTARWKEITPLTVPYLKYVNGQLILDRNHDYFYQIQGQLFCADRQACDLIIFTLKDIKYVHIDRDENFIAAMLTKLQSFYDTYLKDAILQKLFYNDI